MKMKLSALRAWAVGRMLRCPICHGFFHKREPGKRWCVECEGYKRLFFGER